MYQTVQFIGDHVIRHFSGSQTFQTSVLLKLSKFSVKQTFSKQDSTSIMECILIVVDLSDNMSMTFLGLFSLV